MPQVSPAQERFLAGGMARSAAVLERDVQLNPSEPQVCSADAAKGRWYPASLCITSCNHFTASLAI